MRIGLLTDGGYPYTTGESRLWCDRLVRGLARHEFDIYALSRTAAQEERGWVALPPQVRRVRTAPLWAPQEWAHSRTSAQPPRRLGRRERHRFATCFRELAGAICMAGPGGADGGSASSGPDAVGRARNGAPGREGLLRGVPGQRPGGSAGRASDPDGLTITDLTVSFDALALGAKVVVGTGTMGGAPVVGAAATGGSSRFAEALYGLADLAHECGGVSAALRSETAVRVLEAACRTPGASRAVQAARVPDYLAFADLLERALRPLSLDWYDAAGLGDVDLCHAAGGGSAALPGLLAKRFFGVPLLVTEYGVQLRAQYLAAGGARVPVRALMAAFHRRLAAEVYERAALITPGNTHTRRWQEKCGADRAKLRTVYPGMAADRFQTVGEDTSAGDPTTLVWVGRIDPTKDLIALLHAFAEVRRAEPDARLRIFYAGQASGAAPGTQSHGPGPGLYGDAPDGGRGGGAVGGYGAGRARRAGRDFVGDGGGSGHGGGARGCGSAGGGSAGFGGTVFGGAFGGGAYGFGAAGRGSAGYDGAGHGVGAGRSGGSGGSDYGSGSGLGAGSGYGEGSSYGVGPSYGAGSAYGVDGPAYGVGQGYETGPAYGAGPGHGAGPGYAGGSGHGGGAHGFGAPASPLSPESAAYLAHCRGLAAQLFPDEAVDAHAVGDNPVSFEEIGGPGAPELADAYASGSVVVLSSVVEGFPVSLVEAMFCGRATVSTDAGAVVEVIGGTGLVVPPRNPRALADACVALLRDPERRERLGAAARARALELFTVEQNLAAFRGIYLELMSHCPVRRETVDESGAPVPFAHPAEAHVPGSWAALAAPSKAAGYAPSWADVGAHGGGARSTGTARATGRATDPDPVGATGADPGVAAGSGHSTTGHSGPSRTAPGHSSPTPSDPSGPGPTPPDIGRSGSAHSEEATR
ncbi:MULTISPECIES: DUF3492 domain-containing protein [unclassified Streptomyces]|uniref:D-inositol 3-phosphate glycosyltransferase n=1 Tax=Streptomyces sp. NBC_00060 TaxID=2975636 RepID=A0AAU2H088_9ACTN